MNQTREYYIVLVKAKDRDQANVKTYLFLLLLKKNNYVLPYWSMLNNWLVWRIVVRFASLRGKGKWSYMLLVLG